MSLFCKLDICKLCKLLNPLESGAVVVEYSIFFANQSKQNPFSNLRLECK